VIRDRTTQGQDGTFEVGVLFYLFSTMDGTLEPQIYKHTYVCISVDGTRNLFDVFYSSISIH